jgi:Fe-S oxidoreductase
MSAYAERLQQLAASAADRCTGCGKCFEVCPTAREVGLDAGEARTRVGELLALTREGGAAADGLLAWLNACDGSARCSDACPEAINVRQWVTIAKLSALEAARPRAEGAVNAANRFRHMAQAVRLLASMQLPSETLRRILAPAERRTADVLFYTGCNVLRTPHIVLNVMDILDALEVDFDVVGGTAHCCGVYQFQEADLPTYERMGHRTFQRFGQSGASRVLTWCPTCTKNFGELEEDAEPASFDLGHVSEFLAANLDALRARFLADQPKRRVVIHEHLGIGATLDSIRRLLSAVPNLELVELPQDSGFSYACGGMAAKFKAREQAIHRALAEGAVAAGADTVVTMYHSCHRALAGAEAVYPLRVVNFTDVLAEALGRGGHPDYYQLYKRGGAMDEAVAAAAKFLQSNGVRIDETSVKSLTADIFNETGLGGSREAFAEAFTGLASHSPLPQGGEEHERRQQAARTLKTPPLGHA